MSVDLHKSSKRCQTRTPCSSSCTTAKGTLAKRRAVAAFSLCIALVYRTCKLWCPLKRRFVTTILQPWSTCLHQTEVHIFHIPKEHQKIEKKHPKHPNSIMAKRVLFQAQRSQSPLKWRCYPDVPVPGYWPAHDTLPEWSHMAKTGNGPGNGRLLGGILLMDELVCRNHCTKLLRFSRHMILQDFNFNPD